MSGRLVILAGGISSRMKKSSDDISDKVEQKLISDADNKSKSMIGVGSDYRPFLDYLLFNARQSGYDDVVIVIGQNDDSIRNYYGMKDRDNEFKGIKISYAIQPIPEDRTKPLGTADALYWGLYSRPDWEGKKFTVCNSDNLYSRKALQTVLNTEYENALIDYNIDGFNMSKERIQGYAVTKKNSERFLVDIIEKPSLEIINNLKAKDGYVGVSMNIFSFQYDKIMPALINVPLNEIRKEKELPTAVMMLVTDDAKAVYAYPLKEHVPDLTSKEDIIPVKEYLEKEFVEFNFE